MKENKTNRLNNNVDYYHDKPHHDHCYYKPDYDCCYDKPHHDHCYYKPEHDCYDKPKHDYYYDKPCYDYYHDKPHHDKPHYDHCYDKPDYDCCHDEPNYNHHKKPNPCCCPEKTKPQQNNCMKCCDPIEFKCPDIGCAVCTPILADRIYDFKYICEKLSRTVPTVQFTVDTPPENISYEDGAKVCIEKITVVYDCLGFKDPTLPINIDGNAINLTSFTALSCATDVDLYNKFEGVLTPSYLCCDEGRKVSLLQSLTTDNLGVTNPEYIVEGFIGCKPFKARNKFTGGTIDIVPEYPTTNLFDHICLPQTDEELVLKAKFKLELSVKCIIPTSTYNSTSNKFLGTIFEQLLIKEKFHVMKLDELVVYSAPDKFKYYEK